MNSYIYIEDLVANALIQKIEKDQSREVKLSELDEYGAGLVSWWSKKKRIHVTVLLSKYYRDKMLVDYSDFFRIEPVTMGDSADFIIKLQEGKTSVDLRRAFRPYLSIDMLLSFIEAYNNTLGIRMEITP